MLYLLHGLTDDDTAWTRYTSIERYAAAKGLAVVMPQVHRSFYSDEAYGGRFWTFLSEELPQVVGRFFRVSTRREDTFVAGLSMGGYGAFKWALRQPARFAAAASLSGALDVAYIQEYDRRPHMRELTARVFADRILAGGDDDLLHLVGHPDPATLPRLMLRCGTEDHLVAQNQRFVQACERHGVALDTASGRASTSGATGTGRSRWSWISVDLQRRGHPGLLLQDLVHPGLHGVHLADRLAGGVDAGGDRLALFWMPAIWSATFWVASAVSRARSLTSPATTAKPLPTSPARAASMVALSASRLVWSAIDEMILMTSPIAAEAWPSASTSAVIAEARLTASSATRVASSLASRSRDTVSSRARAFSADASAGRGRCPAAARPAAARCAARTPGIRTGRCTRW